MPQFLRLRVQGRDEMRMRMAERVDGDAGGEIEIPVAVGGHQPNALAPLEGEVDTCESRHQMRSHGVSPPALRGKIRAVKTKCAASPGGTAGHSISARPTVNTR